MAKRINRPDRIAVLHFITLSVKEKMPLFRRDAFAREALIQLRQHCDELLTKLIAYVIMPEHMHAVLNPREGEINAFLAQYKPAVTDAIVQIAIQQNNKALLSKLHGTDGHFQLWQEGKHDLYLYSDWMIWQKINYIHNNPIRRQLVEYAADYPYSSFASMYDIDKEAIVPIDKEWWWEDLPMILE